MSFGIPVRNGLGVGLLASTFLSSLRIGGRPAMSLDFIGTNSLDSRITFTRGTTATFVGSNGLIQSTAINVPRFDYNPVTLAPRGLLIEEARTNLLLYSEQFNQANWVKYAGTTITPNAAISPDGSSTADLMYPATSGTNRGVYQAFTGGNLTYTQSIYVKSAGKNFVAFYDFEGATYAGSVDLTTGSTASVKAGYTITPTQAGSGWWRIAVTATTTTGTRYLTMIVVDAASSASVTANGTDGVLVWAGQTEAGAFATSYIPTVASTAPRNADVAVMTGTNFSSWYNQSEGTFVAQFSGPSGGYALNANDGTNNNATGIVYLTGTTLRGITVAAGTGKFVDMTASASPAVNKTAYGYKLNDLGGSTNGGAVLTNTSAAIPTLDRMFIGTFSNFSFLNGHIRAIAYYNTRLPNTQLRVLST